MNKVAVNGMRFKCSGEGNEVSAGQVGVAGNAKQEEKSKGIWKTGGERQACN